MLVKNGWAVVYKKAIDKDGSLLFPERLTKEFLDKARRTMGSYLFANQYQNEVIPEDEKKFRPEWIKRYETIPSNVHHFAFIDPAIGQKDHHDFTGVVVIAVDTDGLWYVKVANRYRMGPTEIVQKVFELQRNFNCKAIGVESVAYQEALIYLLSEEMRKRQKTVPVKEIKRKDISKNSRIQGLVPRFEWSRILLAQGLVDLEDELGSFPRGSFDDLLDALASLEEVVFYPQKVEEKLEKPNSPADPNYERWYRQDAARRANQRDEY